MPVIPATWKSTNRRLMVQGVLGIKPDSVSKITNTERAGRVVQVLEHLPSKHEALSSTTSIAIK
jgi:hypothetical protein